MQCDVVRTRANIEDKAFAGLPIRQLMVTITGLALAYAAMSEVPFPLMIWLAAGGTILLTTATGRELGRCAVAVMALHLRTQ